MQKWCFSLFQQILIPPSSPHPDHGIQQNSCWPPFFCLLPCPWIAWQSYVGRNAENWRIPGLRLTSNYLKSQIQVSEALSKQRLAGSVSSSETGRIRQQQQDERKWSQAVPGRLRLDIRRNFLMEGVVKHWHCLRKWWSYHSWRCSRSDWTWDLVLWFSWQGSGWSKVGLNLGGLFQPLWSYGAQHVGLDAGARVINPVFRV